LNDNDRLSWVVTDSWKAGSVMAPIAHKRGLGLVVLAHGNEIHTKGRSGRERRMMAAFNQADRVVANSSYTASLLAGIGVSGDKVVVIPPGIDPYRFDTEVDVTEFRRQWNLAGRKVILTLARIEPRKGHDQVLAALAAGGEGLDDAVYVVAGEGNDRQRLERLAADLGVSNRVRFVGAVSEADKSVWYRLCDVFAMPNRPETADGFSVEGFGIVFLEAALFAKPVIGGNSGGVPDAVVEGETGYLVEPLDLSGLVKALSTLLTDTATAQRMGEASRKRALEGFTWERIAEQYRKMGVDVVGG